MRNIRLYPRGGFLRLKLAQCRKSPVGSEASSRPEASGASVQFCHRAQGSPGVLWGRTDWVCSARMQRGTGDYADRLLDRLRRERDSLGVRLLPGERGPGLWGRVL